MTNHIPPLHPASPPPLHPASPPPWNKYNAYEYDIDETENLGDYTNAIPHIVEKCQRDSPKNIEGVQREMSKNNIHPILDVAESSCITYNLAMQLDTTKKDNTLGVGLLGDEVTSDGIKNDGNLTLGSAEVASNDDEIIDEQNNTNKTISMIEIDNNFLTNTANDVSGIDFDNSVQIKCTNIENTDNYWDDNVDFKIDLEMVTKEDISEISSDNAFRIEESTSFNTTANDDCVAESSDDSSAIINESAFVVVENKIDIEDYIVHDDSQELSSSPDDSMNDPIYVNCKSSSSNTLPSLKNLNEEITHLSATITCRDDSFFLTSWKESPTKSSNTSKDVNTIVIVENETFTRKNWPYPCSSVTTDTRESSLATEELFNSFTEEDDFDDFVSPPNYYSQSTALSSCENDVEIPVRKEDTLTSISAFDEVHNHNAEKINIIDCCWSDIFQYGGEDRIEVNVNTIEGKLNGSSVWCKMKNIETSPALNYNWNNSETKKILLMTLCIDSRNILFGPRWNSEVPRFASNLGFSPLIPQKACSDSNEVQAATDVEEEIIENSTNEARIQAPAEVRDAHFDWSGSGLTNPLDTHTHSTLLDLDLLANFDIHSPYYKEKLVKSDRRTNAVVSRLNCEQSGFIDSSTNREANTEAARILDSLPNLLVMEKQYIVFPVR